MKMPIPKNGTGNETNYLQRFQTYRCTLLWNFNINQGITLVNKIRIIGLLMILIAIVVKFAFEIDRGDYISGFLFGMGIVLVSTQPKETKKNQ
jgi:hypothetical protein